jgi:hypothetical protein
MPTSPAALPGIAPQNDPRLARQALIDRLHNSERVQERDQIGSLLMGVNEAEVSLIVANHIR